MIGNRGVPIVFLLFTAKTEHKVVHASYNTSGDGKE